ncbi:hypothetical protein BKA62DRAFT_352799 [Auriculariales sp. MPI-PUGE-AT-0066]|nr:hypothetical protein BKA62DRAFT_352799 [Auriculariales sp. MPI-PUGE-AT-0066]
MRHNGNGGSIIQRDSASHVTVSVVSPKQSRIVDYNSMERGLEAGYPEKPDNVTLAAHALYKVEQDNKRWSLRLRDIARDFTREYLPTKRPELIVILGLAFVASPICLWLSVRLGLDPFPRWVQFSLPAARAIFVIASISSVIMAFQMGTSSLAGLVHGVASGHHNFWWLVFGIPIVLAVATTISASPYIILNLSKRRAWNYACADAWLNVEMLNDTAVFYRARDGQRMYSYSVAEPDGAEAAFSFSLVDVRPGAVGVPTLRRVNYNLTTSTFEGSCFADTDTEGAHDIMLYNNTTGCANVRGRFDTSAHVSFNITINESVQIHSRSVDAEWSFENAPVLDLRGATDTGVVYLQTAMHRCPRMRTCAFDDSPHGTLGADVLVPMGWVLRQSFLWSSMCPGKLGKSPYTV